MVTAPENDNLTPIKTPIKINFLTFNSVKRRGISVASTRLQADQIKKKK